MNQDTVVNLATQAMSLALKVAGPLLLIGLVIGLLVSVFQAVTQIQEMTLTFITKLIAVMLILALMGHFMLHELLRFTTTLLNNLDVYAR